MTPRSALTSRPAAEAARGVRCVAVFGTGSAGTRHLRALARVPGARALAVPVRPERRRLLEDNGQLCASDAAEAARLGATHAIIATDTGRHAADAVAALEAGLDILVEKPLARDAAEAVTVTQAARRLGRRAFVGCTLRFSASLGIARKHLASAGALHAARIECASYLPEWRPDRAYRDSYSARAGEGGVLRDLIHEVDYAGWLFGWPRAVQARLASTGQLGIAAEETADLFWETPDGCAVSIHLDYLTRPPRRLLWAAGAQGSVDWDGLSGEVRLHRAGKPAEASVPSQTRDEMFEAQARAFLSAAPDPRLATLEDGVRALAVCDAARQSSASRAAEEVRW